MDKDFVERSCASKRRYFEELDAKIAAEYRRGEAFEKNETVPDLRPYHCTLCGGWHLTSQARMLVDDMMAHGWILHGKPVKSCHLFTDGPVSNLHKFAVSIGLKIQWFQPKSYPHYDLTYSKRVLAIERGAIEIDKHDAVIIWRATAPDKSLPHRQDERKNA